MTEDIEDQVAYLRGLDTQLLGRSVAHDLLLEMLFKGMQANGLITEELIHDIIMQARAGAREAENQPSVPEGSSGMVSSPIDRFAERFGIKVN